MPARILTAALFAIIAEHVAALCFAAYGAFWLLWALVRASGY